MRKIKRTARTVDDLDLVAAIAESMGASGFDQDGVRHCIQIEEMLDRLHLKRRDQFAAILNAIETHIEQGDGSPTVVRHLGDALLAVGAIHLDINELKRLTQLLGELHDHVADHAARRGR